MVSALTHVTRDVERDVELRPMQFYRLMRRIFAYAWPHKRLIILLTIITAMRSVQLPLLAHLLSTVIDGAIAHGNFHGAMVGAAWFAGVALFTQITFGYRVALRFAVGRVRRARHAQRDSSRYLQDLTAAFFNKMKVGRIISRMNSDLEAIRVGVQDIVFITIVGIGQAIFARRCSCFAPTRCYFA